MKIYGEHDAETVQQLERCVSAEEGAVGVLCADGHLGYSMPIGGVVGYREFISPSGVGYDIACGNMAVMTDIRAVDVTSAHAWNDIGDAIQRAVSFGMGRSSVTKVDHPVLDKIAKSPVAEQRGLWRLAADQLGTVGGGNHYVDILEDEHGVLWIGVHFGSRGFGHKTATGFLNIAAGKAFDDRPGRDDMHAPPSLLSTNTASGDDYIMAMQLAGEYAYAGRETVVATVLSILGAHALDTVHNHHNFAWRERHFVPEIGDERMFWVVRKGATPAWPGQLGFVGGSMGDISVILRGKPANAEAASALYSTVHGAGRVMSRRQAAGKSRRTARWQCQNVRKCTYTAAKGGYHKDDGGPTPKCPTCGSKLRLTPMIERLGKGLVDFDAEKQALTRAGIVLRGAGADEAPPVYRKLQSVLDAHAGTIEVVHTLTPRVVVMAGDDVFDAYKD